LTIDSTLNRKIYFRIEPHLYLNLASALHQLNATAKFLDHPHTWINSFCAASMATCSSLPDEVLLHIIEALFEKLTINIAEPRPIEVLRKKRHRRNILCITAVSHKLRSIALAIFEKNRDNVEYTLADIRKFTGVTYRSRFSKVPFSAKLVQLTISAEQIYLCTDYLWPDLHRIARLAKIFPRLRKVIAKSEVSNPHGFNDKDEDAIGMQQYGQKTKFVVGMVKMAYGAHIKQHRRLLYSDWKCENIQLVSKLTFKWMGQTVCS
jgi:hypothetical protein